MTDVSRRSWRPATISGLASIASRIRVRGLGDGGPRVLRVDRRRDRRGTRRPGRHRAAGRRTSRRRSHRWPSEGDPASSRTPARRPSGRRPATDARGASNPPGSSRSSATGGATRCAGRSTCGGSGPAFSPSRARRAAVSSSSGEPSAPQASIAWLMPARRNTPWSVRTWMSSPECELARMAISSSTRSKASMPPASSRAIAPNGLTVERSVTRRSGSPRTRMSSPGRVGLDDVAAMDALLDPVAHLADEDRRGLALARDGCGRASASTRSGGR